MGQETRIRVALHGAAGRMGLGLARLLRDGGDLVLAGAVVEPGSEALGQDLGELAGIGPLGLSCVGALERVDGAVDVVIDFSAASAFDPLLAACQAKGASLVSGTTGLSGGQLAALDAAAARIAVLWAPNMSLGVQLAYRLVRVAASALGDDADVEVHEVHHRYKRDAPSGTALALARAAAVARGQDAAAVIRTDRSGPDAPRRPGEIGVSAARLGDVVGEHTVSFGLDGERIEIVHRAASRAVFLRGALAAARFLARRSPGRYGLADVLGLADS